MSLVGRGNPGKPVGVRVGPYAVGYAGLKHRKRRRDDRGTPHSGVFGDATIPNSRRRIATSSSPRGRCLSGHDQSSGEVKPQ